jgi:phage protein D
MSYGFLPRTHAAPFVEFEFGDRLTRTDRFVNQEFLDRILSMQMTHTDFGMKEMVVRLDNHDLKFFREAGFLARNIDMGQTWTVRWGYGAGAMTALFVFGVRSIQGSLRELEVVALDASNRFETPAKKRTFQGPILRSDVVKQIAESHGYRAEVPNVFPTIKEFPAITQSGMSDGEFITSLADKLGFIWYLEDWFPDEQAVMHFKPRLFGARSRGTFVLGVDQRILGDPVFETDLGKIPESAIGQMYDPYRKSIHEFKAKNDITSRPVLGRATPNAPGVGGNPEDAEGEARGVVHTGAVDAKDLAELVDGWWKIRDQNLVRVTIKFQGMTNFTPGCIITLAGIGQGLDGDYYIAEVKHTISGNEGWTMEVLLLRNALSHIDIYALRAKVMEEIGGQRPERWGFDYFSSEDESPIQERGERLGFHDDLTAEDIKRRFRGC